MYGIYSQKSAESYGTVIWGTPSGGEVEISQTAKTPRDPRFNWPDQVCVGVVTKYLRKGRERRVNNIESIESGIEKEPFTAYKMDPFLRNLSSCTKDPVLPDLSAEIKQKIRAITKNLGAHFQAPTPDPPPPVNLKAEDIQAWVWGI